jgi:hypothetical protein
VGLSAVGPEVPARHVEHRVRVELLAVVPELVEGDPLGMADQPGSLMVQRRSALFQGADSQCHRHRTALAAEAPAGRNVRLGRLAEDRKGNSHESKPHGNAGNLVKTNLLDPQTCATPPLPFATPLFIVNGFTSRTLSC